MASFENTLAGLFLPPRTGIPRKVERWALEVQQSPETQTKVQKEFEEFIGALEVERVVSSSGISSQPSFFRDLWNRLLERFFPRNLSDNDLSSVIHRLEDKGALPSAFTDVPLSILRELHRALDPTGNIFANKLRAPLEDAMRVLSVRLAHLGLDPSIRNRFQLEQHYQEAFLVLPRCTEAYLNDPGESHSARLSETLDLCLEAARTLRDRREEQGVSLSLTFQINSMKERANRLKSLLTIHSAFPELSPELGRLSLEVLRAETQPPRLFKMIRGYLGLVFFQVTEHTGLMAEKYIARSKTEWIGILKKGAIGGLVVGAFAIAKPWAGTFDLPPAMAGAAAGLVYAGIFLAIFWAGGVLATKQPAMTASRLAQALDAAEDSTSFLWKTTELIIQTMRSQIAAVLGNVAVALPVSFLVTGLLFQLGWDGFDPIKAEKLANEINPFYSKSTLIYAAITGLVLSSVGVIAGASQNWFAFNQMANRVRRALVRWFGLSDAKAHLLSEKLSRNFSALTGNIVLGLMLGVLPTLGYIFGLPLGVRHVTFASAQLGIAWAHAPGWFTGEMIGQCLLGVVSIGALNLLVSFGATFFVVLESRGITLKQDRHILSLLIKRIAKRPWEIFVPK